MFPSGGFTPAIDVRLFLDAARRNENTMEGAQGHTETLSTNAAMRRPIPRPRAGISPTRRWARWNGSPWLEGRLVAQRGEREADPTSDILGLRQIGG